MPIQACHVPLPFLCQTFYNRHTQGSQGIYGLVQNLDPPIWTHMWTSLRTPFWTPFMDPYAPMIQTV